MSRQDPRIFLVRHGKFRTPVLRCSCLFDNVRVVVGATTWSEEGRATGITDVELIETGRAQVKKMAATFVGSARLIDPQKLIHVFVSPRKRAKETFKLLLPALPPSLEEKITYTPDIAEWHYGSYEGLKKEDIRKRRKEQGLDRDREWDILKDGCEDGE